MAGVGQRFVDVGYKEPKPLIKIDGKSIVDHACDIFPNEEKFTFICNAKHLAETNMREELLKIKPNANVLEIPNHTHGPVYTLLQVEDLIDDDEEVIVNYCDFGVYWDYEDFLKHTRERDADGVVVSYKKFHPHMFGSTNYALSTDREQWMEEIKEKEPIDKAMEKYVSNGTYYFKRGGDLKKYSKALMDRGITYNNEYYVSLVYNLLVEDGLKVSIYDIPHMLQWGIPQDVETYNVWSNYFRALVEERREESHALHDVTLISMAEESLAFEKVDYVAYDKAKPFIEVGGKPMLKEVVNSLPKGSSRLFMVSEEKREEYGLDSLLEENFSNFSYLTIPDKSRGLSTITSSLFDTIEEGQSILLSPYDQTMLYDEEAYHALLSDEKVEMIVFTHKEKPCGTFFFRNREILKENALQIDGELLGKDFVKTFEVEHLVLWDTPYHYETYTYWQSFFHKVVWHPYTLFKDKRIAKERVDALSRMYEHFEQDYR
jgi:NDP-sugar pyrophosphorylase family protein